MRRVAVALVALGVVLGAALAPAAPSAAHNDDCLVAIHVGGIQVHPACG